jgi:hypothetical protein
MSPHILCLELTALRDDKYEIAVRVPSGEIIQAVAVNRIRSHEVSVCFEILSRHKHSITPLEESKVIRQFGQKLFNFLIGDHQTVYNAYLGAIDGLQSIRLALGLENAEELAYLPWELLRDPERDFLTLSSNISLVRTASHLSMANPIPVVIPFRVLVIVAIQNSERDWRQLSAATTALQASGHLHLERLCPTNIHSLRLRLLAEDYHIIHYIGPSQPPPPEILTIDDVSREYYPESTVRLLVSENTPMSVTMKASFPAIASLQFPIGRSATTLFVSEFYRELIEGGVVDRAVGRARRAIANQDQTGEWAAPVLIAHLQTDVLFRPMSVAGSLLRQS